MSAQEVTVSAGVRPGLRSGRWVITFAATVVSTYALDAVATAAGVLLTASQWLRGIDYEVLLAFLAGTYIVWGQVCASTSRQTGRCSKRRVRAPTRCRRPHMTW